MALALAAGYPTLLLTTRRYHQHWGATVAEIAESLPGDDLVPGSKLDSTAAITIAAPAARVWPWLAQMGYGGRAGFYSHGAWSVFSAPATAAGSIPTYPLRRWAIRCPSPPACR